MSGDAVEDHFIEWFRRNLSGCHFAARVAPLGSVGARVRAADDPPEMFRARLDGIDRGSVEAFTRAIAERPDRLPSARHDATRMARRLLTFGHPMAATPR